MKAKKIFGFGALALAVLAIVVGLCCFFLAGKSVKEVPQTLEVQVVDGEYYLVTEYNGKYSYEFCIEQQFGDDFVLIETVKSDVNNINLSDCNVSITAGAKYRFSARYVFENQKGRMSEYLDWENGVATGA